MKERKSARLSAESLPDVDDLRHENDKQIRELHETTWLEIADDETSPEIDDIAGIGLVRAANLLLKLCQQNEMEKHGKSNEIQCQIETKTRRTMWDIVEEIYRDWKVSAPPETVSTSVNGMLGANYDFWDEDEEDEEARAAGMAGGHSESAHNVLVDDYPVGHGQREKWQIYINGASD